MTFSPTDTNQGIPAWTEACSGVDWVPSPEQLAALFAHPSAVLEDSWTTAAHTTPSGEVQAGTVAAADTPSAADAVVGTVTSEPVPGWVEYEWLDTPVRPEVRALMDLAPGPALLAALACLPAGACPDAHADIAVEGRPVPGSVPGFVCACQVVTAAAWDAMGTWTQTLAAVQLVAIAGQDLVTVLPEGAPAAARTVDPCRAELAPILHLAPDATATRLGQARTLTDHPALVDACAAGLITAAGARAVLSETVNLSPAATVQVVTAVVSKVLARRASRVAGWTASELRLVAKRAVAALSEDDQDQARQDAYNERRVSVTSAGHGMAWLSFLVRDVDAHRIYNRLSAQAQSAKADAREHGTDDQRSADQLRADTAVATLLGQTHKGDSADAESEGTGDSWADAEPAAGATGPVPRPGRAEISVVATLATVLGLAQEPGHVPGLGPIHPDVVREMAADGRWRLWITDPVSGQVIATGSRTYTPCAALARLIRAREPVCRMPGCNRQSVNCDLDHTIPYPGRPGTVESNLGPLCRGHHNLKTHHGFELVNNAETGSGSGPEPGGGPDANGPSDLHTSPHSWTWTMPSGMRHTRTSDPPLGE